MNKRIVLGILVAAAAIGVAIAVGSYEYHAGYAEGLAASGKLTTPGATESFQFPYYPYWGAPFFYRGPFGFFGFVFPVLLLFLIFGLVRLAFFGGWGRPYGWWRGAAPPSLDEWHRRAHEVMPVNRP